MYFNYKLINGRRKKEGMKWKDDRSLELQKQKQKPVVGFWHLATGLWPNK